MRNYFNNGVKDEDIEFNNNGNSIKTFFGFLYASLAGAVLFFILILKDIAEYKLLVSYIQKGNYGVIKIQLILSLVLTVILIFIFKNQMRKGQSENKTGTYGIFLLSILSSIIFGMTDMNNYQDIIRYMNLDTKIMFFFMNMLPQGFIFTGNLIIRLIILLIMKNIYLKACRKESVLATSFFLILTLKFYFINYIFLRIFTIWENLRINNSSLNILQSVEYFLFQIKMNKAYMNNVFLNYTFILGMVMILLLGTFIIVKQEKLKETVYSLWKHITNFKISEDKENKNRTSIPYMYHIF